DALPAVRGQIRDRKNRVLASIRPSYNLYVSPRQVSSDGFAKLRGVLGMSAEQAVEVWERIRGERAGEAGGTGSAGPSAAGATCAGATASRRSWSTGAACPSPTSAS